MVKKTFMDREELLAKLERICTPVLDQMGYRLIEWEYVQDSGRWVVRLYIDAPGGVNVDDCAQASRALGDVIDVEMEIPHSYTLEVSSPGIYRPLRRIEDFAKYRGATIKLKTKAPIDGRGNYRGVIEEVNNNAVAMVVDGMRYTIPFEAIAKARLDEDIAAGTAKGREQS